MCGGDALVFERVRPRLERTGNHITLVGGHGGGQATKVANQVVVALNIAAVGEALRFASKAGAESAKVRLALMGGFASSRILEVRGERMIERRLEPGLRVRLNQEDLGLAWQGARELSLPRPASGRAVDAACAAKGQADLDHAALVKALRLTAGHELARAWSGTSVTASPSAPEPAAPIIGVSAPSAKPDRHEAPFSARAWESR